MGATTSAAVKLLIFAVITTIATAVLAVTIANTQFVPTSKYRLVFTDVAGLLPGDEVRIAGVRVGQVDEIKLSGNLADVTVEIFKTQRLPRSAQAQVRYRNLVGQRYIALSQGSGEGGELPDDGTGVIPQSQTQPALDLTVLFNGFRPLFRALRPSEVNQLAEEIVLVLQGESGTINSLLSHVASLTNTIADRDVVIGRVIDNLNQLVGTLDERDQQVARLITNLRSFVSGLAKDRVAIGDSLVSINRLIGTTDSLVTDVRPSVKADIAQLGKLSETLADNDELIDGVLGRLPARLNELDRAASYGSWFNFYLCSLDAKIALPGAPAFDTPRVMNESERCRE